MEACKITYFGKVLIDLTSDSVAPDDLPLGVTAHSATGAIITGTASESSINSAVEAAVRSVLYG